MKCQVDGKKVFFLDKMLVDRPYYGTSPVYQIGKRVFKIFASNQEKENSFDEFTAKYLKSIKTTQILLPKELVYQEGQFSGYSLTSLSKQGSYQKMMMQPSKEFIRNIQQLEKDITVLSNYNILLNGIMPEHTFYNRKLYITNPSKFSLLNMDEVDYLQSLNLFQLHLLLSKLIISDIEGIFSRSKVADVKALFQIKDDQEKSSEFFADLLEDSENIKQFVKRL